MEMHQVRYFLAVSRTLNFTKAAEECHVAQPSLTRAIQKLEEELGGPLFHRERANTHLTDLGRMMQPHLEKVYAAAQEASTLARGVKKGEVSPLKLGVAQTVAPEVLMTLVRNLRGVVNGFELTMGAGPDATVIGRAVSGEFDLAILGDPDSLPDRVRSWPLFRERLKVLVPASHRFAKLKSVSMVELDREDIIDRPDCPLMDQFKQACAAAGIEPRFRHRAGCEEQMRSLLLSGFGIAVCPEHFGFSEGLVSMSIGGLEYERQVVLAEVAGRRHSTATTAFIRLARAQDWAYVTLNGTASPPAL